MSYGSIYGTSSLSGASGLAADAQSLGHLKLEAGKNTPAAIQETARQFESLFMRELIKSMREASASMKSGLMDNPGSDLGADLLDQQFAVQMSGQPGGLSDLIAQQLTRQMGAAQLGKPATATNACTVTGTSTLDLAASTMPVAKPKPATAAPHPVGKHTHRPTESQVNFVRQHSDAASRVEKATGIPASFMLGQAGHETGWGQHQIKLKGGAPSFNLFGIKAGASWTGKVAEVTTTEFVGGVPQKRIARFRAYDSYEDSFRDYSRMISESPRYAKVRQQTGSAQAFADGLQKAGYATDPNYAAKLSRAINTTMQLRRAQV
ncbi:MAG: flagellar rod assembly protein/muramidase FlgJ [Burkholderiales bacterium RIFCSPLOWO2_12_FULL_61_40]|nr:MAG: flagellar rod assembly protein/muramidase FlgJ [Burkholderiales bacterium RIFCSPLOWO2_12_FULL_61_40]